MKNGKKQWMQICNQMLSAVLVLLGFSACDSLGPGDVPCMYGQPHAKFEIKGKVLDSNKQAISKARIIVKNVTNANSDIPWQRDTLYTKDAGEYLHTDDSAWPEMTYRIVCEDPSGVHKSDSTEVKMKPTGGDGSWNAGSDSREVNFELKKKE